MNDRLENIIKYLDNEMSADERMAFENQLRNDEVLAKEVAFQRGLHGFLDRQKPNLEQKLSNLGDEFILNPPTKKTSFSTLKIIGILSLLALVIYFSFFLKNNTTTNTVAPTIEKNTQLPKDNIESNEAPKEETDKQEEVIELPKEDKKPVEKPTVPIDQPIASLDKIDYSRNPILESVIEENYRSDDSDITTFLTKPKADAVFEFANKIPLVVVGNTDFAPKYRLIVYSNRSFDIENDYRILDAKLDGKPIDGTNQFRFNGQIPLEKGLYYLVIKKDGSRKILHISRFTVK